MLKLLKEEEITYNKELIKRVSNDHTKFSLFRQNPYKGWAVLKRDFGCDYLTIQSGGTLNSLFLKEKLFDFIDIVVAPVLVGGKDTPTVIDGNSLVSTTELNQLGILQLQECNLLDNSYIRLRYRVIN